MAKNSADKNLKVVFSSAKQEGNTVILCGKCAEYDFEFAATLLPFPSEKAKDNAYKVWAETYAKALANKKSFST